MGNRFSSARDVDMGRVSEDLDVVNPWVITMGLFRRDVPCEEIGREENFRPSQSTA